MSRAYTIDWELAKILRSQGLTYAQIAEKVGGTMVAIRSKACREGWNAVAERAREALQQHGIEIASKSIKEQAPKLAEAWLNEMQGSTIERLENLRKLPKPRNLDDAKKLEETMLTHVKAGRASFCLDDQSNSRPQVQIMAQLVQLMDSTPVLQGSTTVEAETQTPTQSVNGCTVDV